MKRPNINQKSCTNQKHQPYDRSGDSLVPWAHTWALRRRAGNLWRFTLFNRSLPSRINAGTHVVVLRIRRQRNRSDKSIPTLGHRFDVERLVGGVTQCLAQLHHRRVQAVSEINECICRPQNEPQFLARDDLPGVFEKEDENAERLLPHLDRNPGAAQFLPLRIDLEHPEAPNLRGVRWRCHQPTPLRPLRQLQSSTISKTQINGIGPRIAPCMHL